MSSRLGLIEALATAPKPLEDICGGLGLAPDGLQRLIDIGELGGYVRQYESPLEKRQILYTPLFMDQHPEQLLNFIAKNSGRYDDIAAVFAQARRAPGLPVSELEAVHPIVVEMINANVIAAPAVDSSSGAAQLPVPAAQERPKSRNTTEGANSAFVRPLW
jgi:hypothetical protein